MRTLTELRWYLENTTWLTQQDIEVMIDGVESDGNGNITDEEYNSVIESVEFIQEVED